MQLRTKVLVIVCASLVSLVTAMSAASLIILIGNTGDIVTRIQYLLLSLAAVGLVISIVTLLLIDKLVIARMFDLVETMRKIGASYDLSARVPATGNDEVAQFAASINNALEELERSQYMLHASEQKFRGMIENIRDAVWELDDRLLFTYVSPNTKDIIGYSLWELAGKSPFDFMPSEERERVSAMIRDMVTWQHSITLVEAVFLHKDGSLVDTEISGTAIVDPKGRITGYNCVTRDVRVRKTVEQAMRLWADIFHFTRMPIAISEPGAATLLMFNPAFPDLFGYTPEELKGTPILNLMPPGTRDEYLGQIDAVNEKGHHTFEITLLRRGGTVFPALVDSTVVRDAAGRVLYRITNVQDITERKRAEEQMLGSLREKEVMLKEIHHRVKNNLQIISSLLSLQSENIGNENPVRLFLESQDRIRSMALIHEKLYQSRDMARVDFAGYVRSLTANLVRSYTRGQNVRVCVDIRDVSLGIDTAIPCGLIINELVSNALKYAFPDGRAGEVRVGLDWDGHAYTLTVADDGVGLPPGFDIRETRTLGLQLVSTLVDQLDGTIELVSTPGTLIRITFYEQRSSFIRPAPVVKSLC
jgi:PAS domain S-box-containing protein